MAHSAHRTPTVTIASYGEISSARTQTFFSRVLRSRVFLSSIDRAISWSDQAAQFDVASSRHRGQVITQDVMTAEHLKNARIHWRNHETALDIPLVGTHCLGIAARDDRLRATRAGV